MNSTTNQSQKEQLTFTYCIGYKYEDSYEEQYDSSMGDFDNLEEAQEEIADVLLETTQRQPLKKVFKIEIWIGNAEDYDEIEFKKEERGYLPNGKVTRAYGKKIEEVVCNCRETGELCSETGFKLMECYKCGPGIMEEEEEK